MEARLAWMKRLTGELVCGTPGTGPGRGARCAGRAATATAEDARNDRRVKRRMGAATCCALLSWNTCHARLKYSSSSSRLRYRNSDAAFKRRSYGPRGSWFAMPRSRSRKKEDGNDDRCGYQSARSDVLAAVPLGAAEIRGPRARRHRASGDRASPAAGMAF